MDQLIERLLYSRAFIIQQVACSVLNQLLFEGADELFLLPENVLAVVAVEGVLAREEERVVALHLVELGTSLFHGFLL